MMGRRSHLMSKRSRKRISAVLAAAVIAVSVLMPAKAYAQESGPAAGQETEAAVGSDIAGGEVSDSAVSAGTAEVAEEKDTSGSTGDTGENTAAGAQTVADDQEDAGNDAGAQEASDDAGDKGENAGAEAQAASDDTGISEEDESAGTESASGLEEEAEGSGVSGDAANESVAPDAADASKGAVSYDYNATLCDPDSGNYPGVYETALTPNSASEKEAPTIGMPSIADGNLDKPTTESPAIIQGAAVGYEEKTGPVDYKTLKDRIEPYTEFKVNVVEEQAQDGSAHKKLTGFDGTYVIVRLDVSEFYSEDEETQESQYLHVKQEKNRAIIPAMGMLDNNQAFADSLGNKTGAYKLKDILSSVGDAIKKPFVDIIMFASGKLAAGADAGKQDVPDGDIPIHFYVDDVCDYNPDLKYDPQSTDTKHAENCLAKFFDTAKAAVNSISNYLIKGSDLALEVAVENSGGENKDEGTTYWSLKKSVEDPYYDLPQDSSPDDPECGRTLKLITEVPVVGGLELKGTDENNLKKRTLNVNSFDIQVANNTTPDQETYTADVTLENAWLKIQDKSNTTGAEMAIGNNAQFLIDSGGKLIIDETCQLEIEWDGATTTPTEGEPAPTPDTLNNGLLDLRAGGEIINNGIITIEGTEGKPYQEGQGQQAIESEKGYGELTIEEGAKLTNNGCIIVNGKMYNLGTIVNNGKYEDVITSNDPDRGKFDYHKGIQLSWKDDVTQNNIEPGAMYNGKDKNGNIYSGAILENNGDILLNPGVLENYATLTNGSDANIYLAAATEAIIPIEPTPEAPTVMTKRIQLDSPKGSVFTNYGTLINNGNIDPASVELLDNAGFGKLTVPGDHPELFAFTNNGEVTNNGHIYGWTDPEPVPEPEPEPKPEPEPEKQPEKVTPEKSSSSASGRTLSTGDMAGQQIRMNLTVLLTALCGLAVVCYRRRKIER